MQDDIARIAQQEERLRFPHFGFDEAWDLGCRLRGWASDHRWPVVVDIRRFDGPLFFAALPGAAPDNVDWARRKANVVQRFHRSSYGMGLELQDQGTTLEARYGLHLADFAAHGGAFPLAVEGVGVIGSVAVSGLPQRQDHGLVVRAICIALGRPEHDLALATTDG